MNIKTFASMVLSPGEAPLKITIFGSVETGYEPISQYLPDNIYHKAAFGDWKISKITAVSENNFELMVETHCTVARE